MTPVRCVKVGRTWGTVELSVFLSAEGTANAISSLMVIFNRLQLDDLGSEESRACGSEDKHQNKTERWRAEQKESQTAQCVCLQ